MQFERTGWVKVLSPHRRLLMVDLRGHGESEKPHDRGAYSLPLLAGDVLAAMDAEGIGAAEVMGYSMGGMVTMELLLEHSERFTRAVIGGMGAHFSPRNASCRDEETGEPPPFRRDWWNDARIVVEFVWRYDRRAMTALSKSLFEGKEPVDAARLGEIRQPVLSVAGTRDWLCPGTRMLAERIPNCERVLLAGRTHMTAVRDPRFKAAVGRFLWGA